MRWPEASEPFGNIAWPRCSGFPQLFAKPEIARHTAGLGKCVDTKFQLVCQLPGVEFIVRARHALLSAAARRRNPEPCEPAHPRTPEPSNRAVSAIE